ncbi:caspase family protein [Bradyrhizobium manausense]|uniref:caspase family protein n=1 Tax=Bradyrhizobium manausense TaxID=989370 RepID=UPI001BA8B027|nr:caspase family protein [Bradyrhizobium manausense]MBR0792202.1 caspase family protein [Bradyrhizobium manausense]
MWRGLVLTGFIVSSFATMAAADPQLGDDLATCLDRQANGPARLKACESLLDANRVTGKDKAVALISRGFSRLSKADFDHAFQDFSAARDADPDNVIAIDGQAQVYWRKGQDDLAMAAYDLALQKRPNYGGAYNDRGLLYIRKGAWQSALDDYNAAVRYTPKFLLGWTNRARVRTMMKDYDGALSDFADAARIDPNAPQIASYRCVTFTAMGRFDEALADCNGVLEKQPKNQFVLLNRGDAYLAKGDLDAALNDYNVILQLFPNNVRAHAGRGQVFERKQDLAQARADYRAAAFALTPFDEIETTLARASAKSRLAVLEPKSPAVSTTLRRVALVIGNGAYRNVHALSNPPRDSKLIAAALRDVGFQTVTVSNDLSRDQFFATLHAFAAEAEKADWAVVYYAGHGFEIGGVNYLVPVDARLAVDKDAEREAVALEQVVAAVGGAHKLRLVILDACRDNPFKPTMQQTLSLKLVDKGFSNIEPGIGFMVVYAAKHGETAMDGDGSDSPFALALAHEVQQPHIEIRKLFDIVRDDVWSATRHTQQPFTYGSPPGSEDFYFVAGK